MTIRHLLILLRRYFQFNNLILLTVTISTCVCIVYLSLMSKNFNGNNKYSVVDDQNKQLNGKKKKGLSRLKWNENLDNAEINENVYSMVSNDKERNKKMLSCTDISKIKSLRKIGEGTTKEAYLGNYLGRRVVVKRVGPNVNDIEECKKKSKQFKEDDCYLLANYKLTKEILLQLQLDHPNLIQLMGYCVKNEEISSNFTHHGVLSIVEFGIPLDIKSQKKKWHWKIRLKIVKEILNLLNYLEHSPLGSLAIVDYKISHFFVIGETIKMGDIDDLTNVGRACDSSKDCKLDGLDLGLQCIQMDCQGINSKRNLKNSQTLLLELLEEFPGNIRKELNEVKDDIKNLRLTAKQLQEKLKDYR